MRVGLLIHPGGFLGSGGGKRCRINFDTKLGHPQQSLTTFCLLSCNKSLVVLYVSNHGPGILGGNAGVCTAAVGAPLPPESQT